MFEFAVEQLKEANIEGHREESLLLLSKMMAIDQSYIIARMEEEVPDEFDINQYEQLVKRRALREPFAYLFNECEFYNRSFSVGPGVLIPRPETEHLIETVLEEHQHQNFKKVVDLCSGSGIIAITLQLELEIETCVVDVSNEALQWAKKNVQQYELSNKCKIIECDILQSLPDAVIDADCITMNPPYICHSDCQNLSKDITEYEPHLALFGGDNQGLSFTLKVLERLAEKVHNGTQIFIELGYNQKSLLESQTLYPWAIQNWKKDLAGIHRIVHLKKIHNG